MSDLLTLLEWREELAPGAVVLHGFARAESTELLRVIDAVAASAPFRHFVTPGGRSLAAAMTNCGALGWVSDAHGYRYQTHDPLSGERWPIMPALVQHLAQRAAAEAGYPGFISNACLINRYVPGTGMGLHQDRNENDVTAPIVSVSLGLPATFRFGGTQRGGTTTRCLLNHGDVAVWGGPARLAFHGISPLKLGTHPDTGSVRYNLTLRWVRNLSASSMCPEQSERL